MAGPDREERIRERAHALWLSEGQPSGGEERHWLQAASEIDAEDKKPKKAAAAKKAVAKPAAKKAAAPKAAAPAKKEPAAKKAAPKKK